MELIRLEKEHLSYANNLRNQYIKYIRQPFPHNLIQQEKWLENTSDVYWVIKTNGDKDWTPSCEKEIAGVIGLTNVDLVNRKAELSLITEDYLIKEYADFALDFVENYFFEKLNGHKLFITAYEFDHKKNKYFSKRYKKEYEMADNVCWDNIFYKEICYSKIREF